MSASCPILETGCGPIDIYVVRVLEGFGTLPTPLQHKSLSYPKASSTSYPKALPTNYPKASSTSYPKASSTNYPKASPTSYPKASPTNYPKASPKSYPKASPTNNLSVKLSGKPNKHDLASTYISHQTGQM
ncbi:cell division septation protein DedD [Pedobacter cryoconitis]|uniref:Cell division septation protein DedD n=1 Tax=Pedobacter cryoconitis TaxID=188932 RepID=A0A7W9E2B0_9SPHI|nr:hypothetical protein [Pedobacter cryoconitis]MBB5638590.1 cell division septation protein DedD [Pedobacter cryoconitis]